MGFDIVVEIVVLGSHGFVVYVLLGCKVGCGWCYWRHGTVLLRWM